MFLLLSLDHHGWCNTGDHCLGTENCFDTGFVFQLNLFELIEGGRCDSDSGCSNGWLYDRRLNNRCGSGGNGICSCRCHAGVLSLKFSEDSLGLSTHATFVNKCLLFHSTHTPEFVHFITILRFHWNEDVLDVM